MSAQQDGDDYKFELTICDYDNVVPLKKPVFHYSAVRLKKPIEIFRVFLDKFQPNDDGKFLLICLHANNPGDNKPVIRHTSSLSDDMFNEFKRLNDKGYGVFVTVNKTKGKSRKKEDVTQIRAVWVEDDNPVEKPRKKFPIKPTMIVQSSHTDKGKKLHYYWVVDDAPDEAMENFDGVMTNMVNEYGSDPNAKDMVRVLRVPGFYNMKEDYDKPFADLVSVDGPTYDWSEITKAFPPSETAVNVSSGKSGEKGDEDFDKRLEFDRWAEAKSNTSGKAGGLNLLTAQSGLVYEPPKGGNGLKKVQLINSLIFFFLMPYIFPDNLLISIFQY